MISKLKKIGRTLSYLKRPHVYKGFPMVLAFVLSSLCTSVTQANECNGVNLDIASRDCYCITLQAFHNGHCYCTIFWDFGDGTTLVSNGCAPIAQHCYPGPGTYVASVYVDCPAGDCATSLSITIPVPSSLTSGFVSATECANTCTQFTDQSTGNFSFWEWDFGDGDSSTVQNPCHVYSSGGTYQTTLTILDTNGCSSSVVNTVTVLPETTQGMTFSICQGDSIFAEGGWQKNTGVYYDTLIAANGCDSGIVTSLTVNPVYVISTSVAICQGDSVFAGGGWQTNAGNYNDNLISINGCDSTVITTLTVNPVYLIVESISTCPGDSVFVGGGWETAAGIYTDSLISINGCDSTVITTLTIDSVYLISVSISICQEDSVFVGGAWQKDAGNYNDSLSTIKGCDSILITTIDVNPVYTTSGTSSICQGDSMLIAGVYQSTAATYYDSLSTASLCDSITITILTVNPLPDVGISGLDFSYCTTDGTVTLTGIPNGGLFTGTGGSVVGNEFMPATGANNYTITYSYTDTFGCSDSTSQIVTVSICTGMESLSSSPSFSIYPNPVGDQLYIVSKSMEPFSYRVYDLLGRELLSLGEIKSRKFEVDLKELSSSVYFIELTQDKMIEVFKVIKKN